MDQLLHKSVAEKVGQHLQVTAGILMRSSSSKAGRSPTPEIHHEDELNMYHYDSVVPKAFMDVEERVPTRLKLKHKGRTVPAEQASFARLRLTASPPWTLSRLTILWYNATQLTAQDPFVQQIWSIMAHVSASNHVSALEEALKIFGIVKGGMSNSLSVALMAAMYYFRCDATQPATEVKRVFSDATPFVRSITEWSGYLQENPSYEVEDDPTKLANQALKKILVHRALANAPSQKNTKDLQLPCMNCPNKRLHPITDLLIARKNHQPGHRHSLDNVFLSCARCNLRQGNSSLQQFSPHVHVVNVSDEEEDGLSDQAAKNLNQMFENTELPPNQPPNHETKTCADAISSMSASVEKLASVVNDLGKRISKIENDNASSEDSDTSDELESEESRPVPWGNKDLLFQPKLWPWSDSGLPPWAIMSIETMFEEHIFRNKRVNENLPLDLRVMHTAVMNLVRFKGRPNFKDDMHKKVVDWIAWQIRPKWRALFELEDTVFNVGNDMVQREAKLVRLLGNQGEVVTNPSPLPRTPAGRWMKVTPEMRAANKIQGLISSNTQQ